MAEIFISYKSERRAAARHLKKVLECYFQADAEECVWYDYGLIPGDEFEPRLMEEIAKAQVVIVLWCRMAVESAWVLKEARAALNLGKLLPARIESCAIPETFAALDTINLSEWDASPSNQILHRLLEDLARRLGREALSRVSQLRGLEEDWRSYGAPSLTSFALGAGTLHETRATPDLASERFTEPVPEGASENLATHWDNAVQGDTPALCSIAYAYFHGTEGLGRDEFAAVKLWRLAASRGDQEGLSHLGQAFKVGEGGLPKDLHEAARLFRLGADKGSARAQFELGRMYGLGQGGLPKDESEAARLYKLAADQGSAGAQCNLANMHFRGGGGLAKNEVEAVRLWRLSAEQGNARAHADLGVAYENGEGGLNKDPYEAVRHYRFAADAGNALGQLRLGMAYESGIGGCLKDRNVARRLFKLAADQGDAKAREKVTALGDG